MLITYILRVEYEHDIYPRKTRLLFNKYHLCVCARYAYINLLDYLIILVVLYTIACFIDRRVSVSLSITTFPCCRCKLLIYQFTVQLAAHRQPGNWRLIKSQVVDYRLSIFKAVVEELLGNECFSFNFFAITWYQYFCFSFILLTRRGRVGWGFFLYWNWFFKIDFALMMSKRGNFSPLWLARNLCVDISCDN